jgi:hypothetical protein
MTTILGLAIGFLVASIIGAVFCKVLLTMYERAKSEINSPDAARTRRFIFRWSLGGGLVFGFLAMIPHILRSI